MESVLGLQEAQLDALREIANIGAGNAATALNQMTGQTVQISVPSLFGLDNAQLPRRVFEGMDEVAMATVAVVGDLAGYAAFLLPAGDVETLCSYLMPSAEPAVDGGALNPMARSVLQEVLNVLAGSYLNALASLVDMSLYPALPTVGILPVDQAVAAIGEDAASVVICAATAFAFGEDRAATVLRSQFLHLPDEASLQAILAAIDLA